MAKRKSSKAKKAAKRAKPARRATRRPPARRLAKPSAKRSARKAKRSGQKRPARRQAAPAKKRPPRARKPPLKHTSVPKAAQVAAAKVPRLERARRTLEETVQTPPSSLNMDRHGSAARTGRAEIAEHLRERRGMEDVTGGDPDVDSVDAFFTGEEAPGGDNPTPDQDIVDDIGKALGVQYEDNEELKSGDKVAERDKHRWELDPASSDDYRDRK
jgi:Family of unknown function (DUF6335)